MHTGTPNRSRASHWRPAHRALAVLLAAAACTSDSTTAPIAAGRTFTITTTHLPPLDAAREGRYVVWFFDASGLTRSGGDFTVGTSTLATPIADPVALAISIERPGVPAADGPSGPLILQGRLAAGHAALTVVGAVTQRDVPLRERAGQFTMFTPSDNDVNGYPSHESSGVWLFNVQASTTEQNDFYVRLAQLQTGWTYEGWMVRDYGTPLAIWLSYGKFVPDWAGAVNSPDDTGWGPFSGVTDYTNSRLEDFPGDDYISNPLHLPFPSALTLPLDFRERNASGQLRWTHVISIEPGSDRGEPIGSERPFFLRPYVDPFGDLNPGAPRTITFHPDAVPSAVVEVGEAR
jgi:hypothetical protein